MTIIAWQVNMHRQQKALVDGSKSPWSKHPRRSAGTSKHKQHGDQHVTAYAGRGSGRGRQNPGSGRVPAPVATHLARARAGRTHALEALQATLSNAARIARAPGAGVVRKTQDLSGRRLRNTRSPPGRFRRQPRQSPLDDFCYGNKPDILL